MNKVKPIVAMDLSSTGKGGGPYTSTNNIINSNLKDKYDYRIIEYNTSLGRFISIKRIKDIVKQLRTINPDIVHISGLQFSCFHILVACKIVRIKNCIVTIRGSSTEALNINLCYRAIMYMIEMFSLAMSTCFYGVSRHSSQLPPTKWFKSKNKGVINNLFVYKNGSDSFVKNDFGFNDDDIVVVSVARITKDKGYHILKDAIMSMNDETRVKFLIVGDGAYLPQMKDELSELEKTGRVKFLGYRADVYKILPACDMFILPTLHENMPNALLEASANRLALIGSNVGGVPEVITEGENGFLVPPSDSEAIKDAIIKLASDKSLRVKMGENALRDIEEKFSSDMITSKIDKLYQTVLNKNS